MSATLATGPDSRNGVCWMSRRIYLRFTSWEVRWESRKSLDPQQVQFVGRSTIRQGMAVSSAR
jgi:hypothetical protein